MELKLCLICCSKPVTNQETSPRLLEQELFVVFVLRELLKIPQNLIADCFQASNGDNLSSWFGFCSDCHSSVKKAEKIFQEIILAQKKLNKCQRETVQKIKSSTSKLAGVRNRRNSSSSQITDTICDFVTTYQYAWPDDDASAGDRMAKQLLDFKLHTVNPNSVTPPPLPAVLQIKEETSPINDEPDTDFEDNIDIGEETVIQVKLENPEPTKKLVKTKTQGQPVGGPPKRLLKACSYCAKMIVSKNLARHELIHTKRLNYSCEICKREFASHNSLSYHLKTHKDEKEFVCKFKGCQMAFIAKQQWESHEATHTNTRKYKCDREGCNRGYNSAAALKTHIVRRHDS